MIIPTGRVPIRDPLELREGVITNPQWIKWLTEQLAPVITSVTVGGIPQLNGTRARRLATSAGAYQPGVLFFETDTGLVYIVNSSSAWQYSSGTYDQTQAQLAALALTLTANDTGLKVDVTDYDHILRWTGTVWTWGIGERSAYFQDYAVAPDAPGWHACDGAVVNYLKGDGTLGAVTLPNTVATASYRKSGATYASVITAATVPLLTMNSYTPTGINSVPLLTMNSYTPQGTNSVPALTMNSYTPAGAISAPVFTGTPIALTSSVFTAGLVAAITSVGGSTTTFTPAGTISSPVFTGTPATLTGTVAAPVFTGTAHILTGTITAPLFVGDAAVLTGTISLPGDPVAHYQAVTFFRQ